MISSSLTQLLKEVLSLSLEVSAPTCDRVLMLGCSLPLTITTATTTLGVLPVHNDLALNHSRDFKNSSTQMYAFEGKIQHTAAFDLLCL